MFPVGNCEEAIWETVPFAFSTKFIVIVETSNDCVLINVDNALINANRTPNPKSFLMSLKGYFNPSTTQSVMLATLSP